MIVKTSAGYVVKSERSKKRLGGPYKTRAEAEKRLRQVEFFKHRKGHIHVDLLAELFAVGMSIILVFSVLLVFGLWAEYSGTGTTPVKEWKKTRPAHAALLRGTDCIPISTLLVNRAIPAVHSYSRSVACERP